MPSLTDFQRDAISELLNIGMGRAANALSQMANAEVQLSVPFVYLMPVNYVTQLLGKQASDSITVVKQQFTGMFGGDALLLFPEDKSLELVRIVLQEMVPLERMGEMEQESLIEIGNVILNACLGSLANLLNSEIDSSLPELLQEDCARFFSMQQKKYPENESVLFLKMDFKIQEKCIGGHVAFMIDGKSVQALQDNVEKLLMMFKTAVSGLNELPDF